MFETSKVDAFLVSPQTGSSVERIGCDGFREIRAESMVQSICAPGRARYLCDGRKILFLRSKVTTVR